MLKIIAAFVISLAVQVALAQDSAIGSKSPTANQASEKSLTPATTPAAEKKDEEFKPPRGFQTKKRGDLVLYCKKETTVGTRFKTEKCYDEKQMREYMLALEIQRQDVDRIRSTCGGGTTCAPLEPGPR